MKLSLGIVLLIGILILWGCQQAPPPPAQTVPGQVAQPGQPAAGTTTVTTGAGTINVTTTPGAPGTGTTTVTTPGGQVGVTTGPGGSVVTTPGGTVEVKTGAGGVEVTGPDGKKVTVNTGGAATGK